MDIEKLLISYDILKIKWNDTYKMLSVMPGM